MHKLDTALHTCRERYPNLVWPELAVEAEHVVHRPGQCPDAGLEVRDPFRAFTAIILDEPGK